MNFSVADAVHRRMIALTRWFAENLTLAGPGCEMDHYAELSERPLNGIIADLRCGAKAAMCGGLAVLLQQVARQYGIQAVALNFGFLGTKNTHVIVAAKLTEGSYSFYCPTFGLAIVNASNGRPASVELIAESLRCRRVNCLQVTRLTRQPACMIFARPPTNDAFNAGKISANYLEDGRIRYVVTRPALVLWCARQFTSELRSKINDASVVDILRFPLSTSGEADAEGIAATLGALPRGS